MYKAELRVSLPDFSIVIPVRYERLSNESEKAKQQTFLKVGDVVVEKRYEIFNNRAIKIDVNGDGSFLDYQSGEVITDFCDRRLVITDGKTIFQEQQVKEYRLEPDQNGQFNEIEVEPDNETTKVFEITQTRPLSMYQEYCFDYEYEVCSDKKKTKRIEIGYEPELLKLVEYLHSKQLLGLFGFRRAGLLWCGVLRPIIVNGYFTLVMGLTLTVKQYKHLYEIDLARNRKVSEPVKKVLASLNV